MGREIRVPYFLPRIRWWESNTRFQLSVPVKMMMGKHEKSGKIVDLSIGGCYVKTTETFDEQAKLSLEFRVFGQTLSVMGIVVWKSREGVTRPQGIGVKFTKIEKDEMNRLRVALKRIKRVSAFYKKMPDESDQEYLAQAFEDAPESNKD